MSSRRLVVVLAVLAAVLGGCRLDVRTSVVVAGDGSGTADVTARVDGELRDRIEAAGLVLADLVPAPAPAARWSLLPPDEADAGGLRLSTTFDEPQGLGAAVRALTAGLDPDDGTVLEDVVLERTEEGGFVLSVTGGLVPPRVLGTTPLGDPGGGSELAEELRRRGDQLATAVLDVTFPTVPTIEAGEGEVEGTTARVVLPVGELATVVVSAPPARLVPVEAAVAGGVGLAAAVLLVVLVARRRRGD